MIEHLSDGVIAHISLFGELRALFDYVHQDSGNVKMVIEKTKIKSRLLMQKSKAEMEADEDAKSKYSTGFGRGRLILWQSHQISK